MAGRLQPLFMPHTFGFSRREFLMNTSCGFGYLAFLGIAAEAAEREHIVTGIAGPLAPKRAQFAPRAKRIIFLFMHGGVSHIDTFDQIGRASCRERV